MSAPAPAAQAAPPSTLDRSAVEARLAELEAELENGTRHLAGLDAQRADVAATLERIRGAATVLEELLAVPTRPAVVAPVTDPT